ncbi:bifunctional 2-polyprenyl-6-hydroxyphenol methylase/3-demethylubiquinol 3-O-methyltransferase UbiG [uncultured Piscinibacter sp.]|uniref:class I SAM-dependent methyltransferase n=1 Tax=uncultured Piscinibacter sp. TaxID=1131835 RepID=UPI00260BDB05|nr:class I SAM-dependent methyltransferase [uncultured Piscinibacter sp.]
MLERTPSIEEQAAYWDGWNVRARSDRLPPSSQRQGDVVEAAVAGHQRRDLSIVDIGCGTGWMCERLVRYGSVTGIDITAVTLAHAARRVPQARFLCGDVLELDLPQAGFDVAVCLEVLSHVADQPAFVARLADLLRPGGTLVLATQNRPVLQRWSVVAEPDPSQIRHWVDHRELRSLLAPRFATVRIESLVPVGDRGLLRMVNSPRLNGALARFVPPHRIERAKEWCMLGHSLVATATRV